MATHGQLIEAGDASGDEPPSPPWHPIRGPRDASTLFYAVLRKPVQGRDRNIWIGLLCIRHGGRQAFLEDQGWEEVKVEDIGVGA